MGGAALGGTLKITLAAVIGWAWLSGRLEARIAEILAVFGGQPVARGNATLPQPSSSSSASSTSTLDGILT